MRSKSWLLLLLLVAIVVRLPTMFGVKRTGWDERAYAVFAQTLTERGLSGIHRWMHDYPTDESLQRSPLFLRVGFIVPAALVCKALGGFNADNLAWLSFASGLGLITLGAQFAEKLAGRRLAILCGIFLITSPLAAGLSRRGTQDVYAALIFLACLYFFHECWHRRTWLPSVALGVAVCIALLTKESAIFLYPIMGVAAIYYYRAMKLRPAKGMIVALIAGPLVYFLIEIAICGGVGEFVQTYRIYASLPNSLEYTTHYQKGPWFRYLVDFVAIAPLAFVIALVGLAGPEEEEPVRDGRNLAALYLLSGLLLFGQLPILNVRLVLFIDVFLRLAAAVGVSYIATRLNSKRAGATLLVLTALVVISDAFQFYRIFVTGNVYDPTTFILLRANGFYDTP